MSFTVELFQSIGNAEWLSETSLLYFFSALAQCAAGFAALIGVFAVFRLQANAPAIVEEYSAAKNWLHTACTLRDAVTFPRKEVRNKLQEIIDQKWKPASPEAATKILLKINEAEEFDRKLAYEASWPLKLWGGIFLFSIGIIPYTKLYLGLPGVVVFLFFITFVIWALFMTKRFVQKCLSFDSGSSGGKREYVNRRRCWWCRAGGNQVTGTQGH